jgi:hypothetical protein
LRVERVDNGFNLLKLCILRESFELIRWHLLWNILLPIHFIKEVLTLCNHWLLAVGWERVRILLEGISIYDNWLGLFEDHLAIVHLMVNLAISKYKGVNYTRGEHFYLGLEQFLTRERRLTNLGVWWYLLRFGGRAFLNYGLLLLR